MTNNKTPSAREMAALFRRKRAEVSGAIDRLLDDLVRVTAERDAAVKDLCLAGDCDTCYMRGKRGYSRCSPAVHDENGTCVGYKWRGPQKEE